jgi:hypothetical protein
MAHPLEHLKGAPMRYCGGSWKGHLGWINCEKGPTALKRHTIVDLDDGFGGLKKSCVEKGNCDARFSEPNNLAEAAMQQHSDIEDTMRLLAKQLAACNVQPNNDILVIIQSKLDRATEIQRSMGSKAKWRAVEYDEYDVFTVDEEESL